jgi:hypothetical protein
MASFKVLRQMDDDRLYLPGDVRELSDLEAAHLVAAGALEPIRRDKALAGILI